MRLFVSTIFVLALAGCSSRQQASDPKTDDPVPTPRSVSKEVDIDDVNRAIARLQSSKDRFTSLGDEAEIGAMILGEMGPPGAMHCRRSSDLSPPTSILRRGSSESSDREDQRRAVAGRIAES